jgi:hypothetical protein
MTFSPLPFLIDLTSAILIIFGYLPKETLINTGASKILATGVTRWLEGSFAESRKIGMVGVLLHRFFETGPLL